MKNKINVKEINKIIKLQEQTKKQYAWKNNKQTIKIKWNANENNKVE